MTSTPLRTPVPSGYPSDNGVPSRSHVSRSLKPQRGSDLPIKGLCIKQPAPKRPSLEDEVQRLREQVADQQTKITELCTALEAMGQYSDPQLARKLAVAVATKHGISFADLVSDRRQANLVRARQEAMWRLKRNTRLSLPQIGRILGNRDHSTILYGIRRHEQRLAGEIA